MNARFACLSVIAACLWALPAAAGDDDEPVVAVPPDPVMAKAIDDLVASAVNSQTVVLTWTSQDPAATAYLIRWSEEQIIDEATWAAAHEIENTLSPRPPSGRESLVVGGFNPLNVDLPCWFAILTVSATPFLSNSPEVTIPADHAPPQAPGQLTAIAGAVAGVELQWLAPCDEAEDEAVVAYQVVISTSPLTPADFVPANLEVPAPDAGLPGALRTMTIASVPAGLYYVGVRALDERSNASEIVMLPMGSEPEPEGTETPVDAASDASTRCSSSAAGSLGALAASTLVLALIARRA